MLRPESFIAAVLYIYSLLLNYQLSFCASLMSGFTDPEVRNCAGVCPLYCRIAVVK